MLFESFAENLKFSKIHLANPKIYPYFRGAN